MRSNSKWYYIWSRVIEIPRKVVRLWTCIQKEVCCWFTMCYMPSKVWFLLHKKSICPYFFFIISWSSLIFTGFSKTLIQEPQIRPLHNLKNKFPSDTYWRIQLVCMKVQAHSSLEPPLGYNQDQKPLTSQGWFSTLSTNLGVIEILYSFRLVLKGKAGKEIPVPSRSEFLEKFSWNNFALLDAEGNTSEALNRRGIADLSWNKNTISISPKFTRAKFLGSGTLFSFIA